MFWCGPTYPKVWLLTWLLPPSWSWMNSVNNRIACRYFRWMKYDAYFCSCTCVYIGHRDGLDYRKIKDNFTSCVFLENKYIMGWKFVFELYLGKSSRGSWPFSYGRFLHAPCTMITWRKVGTQAVLAHSMQRLCDVYARSPHSKKYIPATNRPLAG
jgi:hypothetical protein